MIFKIIYFKEPLFLFEKLKFAHLERTCNLICPQVRNEANKYKFKLRSASLWKSLPIVKFANTKSELKVSRCQHILGVVITCKFFILSTSL